MSGGALVPQPRYSKIDIFKKQAILLKNVMPKLLLIGDSLISNLSLFPEIWKKYFLQHEALNLGVRGDKTQNVLWRIKNMTWPNTVSSIFILSGTNNLGADSPLDTAQSIILCGISASKHSPNLTVTVLSLLPRDKSNS